MGSPSVCALTACPTYRRIFCWSRRSRTDSVERRSGARSELPDVLIVWQNRDPLGMIVRGHAREPLQHLVPFDRQHVALHAGRVLHTHSVWSTMLSDTSVSGLEHEALTIDGYEMLKGLAGVKAPADRDQASLRDRRRAHDPRR